MGVPIMDLATVLIWGIAYIFIIISGLLSIKSGENKVAMPYIAGMTNFAWEICALIKTSGRWMYILWFSIDLFIVCINTVLIKKNIHKIVYFASILLCCIIVSLWFKSESGFMYSVYLIDLIMSLCYLLDFRNLSRYLQKPIAITKMLGSFCASFVFKDIFVIIIEIGVLFLNGIYVFKCYTRKTT